MMRKIICLVIFTFFYFFFFLAQDGLASVGTAISPATSSHTFTLDGGTIDFTVFNTGSEDTLITLTTGGTAADFTYVELGQAMIKPNSYVKFNVIIDPSRDVKEGESYTLTVTAKTSGGSVAVGAESGVNLYFEGERTKPYVEKTTTSTVPPSIFRPSKRPIPTGGAMVVMTEEKPKVTPYVIPGIGVIILVGVVYAVYRKRQ